MEITVLVAVIGCVITVISYFAGVKKSSTAEVEKRAYFEGEIKAKLDQLLTSFDKLEAKLSKNTDELYAQITKEIEEHERRYHKDERRN